MKSKITSLSKNIEFKSLLNGKKISNKYSTIFFKKLSNKNAKKLNVSTLLGTYIPTDRNMIVKDHYKKLGFIKISKNSEAENWELNISDYRNKDIPMILKYIDR